MINIAVISRPPSGLPSHTRMGADVVLEHARTDVRTAPHELEGRGRGAMWLVRHDAQEVSRADIALLSLLASGMPAPRVARTLAVSDRTIRRRVRSICDAIGVGTAIEAVAWAARRRLI